MYGYRYKTWPFELTTGLIRRVIAATCARVRHSETARLPAGPAVTFGLQSHVARSLPRASSAPACAQHRARTDLCIAAATAGVSTDPPLPSLTAWAKQAPAMARPTMS